MDRELAARAKALADLKNKRQILIGIPSNDDVKANFAMAFGAMNYYNGLAGIATAIANQKGSILPANRNRLIGDARGLNCSHLLQIDSDLSFPPYALARLLSHKKPIVGATYARRSQPHDNLAVPLNRQPVQNAAGLTAVDRLPTGMLLIEMEVFKKIKQPVFRFPTLDECEPYPAGNIEGEDYYFCDSARQAGYEVFLDVELSFNLIHWGEAGWRLKEETEDPNALRYELIELQSTVQKTDVEKVK